MTGEEDYRPHNGIALVLPVCHLYRTVMGGGQGGGSGTPEIGRVKTVSPQWTE